MINLLHSWLQPPQQLGTHFVPAGHEALQHGSTKHGTRFLQGPKTKLDSKYYLLQNGTELIVNSDQIKNQWLDLKKQKSLYLGFVRQEQRRTQSPKKQQKLIPRCDQLQPFFLQLAANKLDICCNTFVYSPLHCLLTPVVAGIYTNIGNAVIILLLLVTKLYLPLSNRMLVENFVY